MTMENRQNLAYQDDFTDSEIAEIYSLLSRLPAEKALLLPAQSLLEHAERSGKAATPLLDADYLTGLVNETNPISWRKRAAACWLLGRGYMPEERRSEFRRALRNLLDTQFEPSWFFRHLEQRFRWAFKYTLLSGIPYGLICLLLLLQNELVLEYAHTYPRDDVPILKSSWLGTLYPPSVVHGKWDLFNALEANQSSAAVLHLLCLLLVCTMPIMLTGSIIWAGNTRITATVRKWAAFALGRHGTEEDIPSLRRAALNDTPEVSFMAAHGYVRLLSAKHGTSFVEECGPLSARLCHLLDHAAPDIALSILLMLEQVGDGRAVPTVEWQAECTLSQAVRETALRILPLLRERKRQEENPTVLLRASSSSAIPSGNLLRPAAETHSEAEQLLRPGSR